MDAECNSAFRACFVDQAGFERSVCLNERFEYGYNVTVVCARGAQCGLDEGINGEKKQLLMRRGGTLRRRGCRGC